MPKKILLPVDGSEHARKAAALAGDLAEKYDSELILLHVIQSQEIGEQERHMAGSSISPTAVRRAFLGSPMCRRSWQR